MVSKYLLKSAIENVNAFLKKWLCAFETSLRYYL